MLRRLTLAVFAFFPFQIAAAQGASPGQSAETLPEKCGLRIVAQSVRDAKAARGPDALRHAALFERTERQKSRLVGRFRVHYDTTGIDAARMLDQFKNPIPGSADEFADSVGAIANEVWAYEVDELGYESPPPDGNGGGGPEFDIYVLNLGSLYGTTFPETALGGRKYTTYIEIDNDFEFVNPTVNKGLPALRVTIAHEFQHAIQIGSYGFWEDHVYFYEITSTWMEDVVFPEVNDYIQYLISSSSHFALPEVPFTSTDFIMYSRGIWGHFVAKRYGRDAIRTTWEISEASDVPPLVASDMILSGSPYFSGLREAFSEWAVWNYFTGSRHKADYYPEGASYPVMTEYAESFTPPLDSVSGALAPLASRYHRVFWSGTPLVLLTTNVDFISANGGVRTPLPYSYALTTMAGDTTYEPTLAGIFVRRTVSDAFSWSTYAIVNDIATLLGDSLPARAISKVFPNPFVPGGTAVINIPVDVPIPTAAELSIFSSDMALVHSSVSDSRSTLGRQVFQWNGRNSSGELAATGIYFFVINIEGEIIRGKFAVIRK
jgi:hypothetical protein